MTDPLARVTIDVTGNTDRRSQVSNRESTAT